MRQDAARKEIAKEKLRERIETSIQTTMIGALASVEEHFGYLWGKDKRNLTPEEYELKQVFEILRNDILTKGNTQMRNIPKVLQDFEVDRRTYHYEVIFSKDRK